MASNTRGVVRTTATDYANLEKQRFAEQQGVESWEKYFSNIYNKGAEQLTSSAYKDVSSAYSNYLNQQLAIKASENLMAGYKSSLNKDLYSAYGQYYDEAMSGLSSNLTELATNVGEQASALNEEYLKRGEFMAARDADLAALAYDLYGETYGDLFNATYDDEGDLSAVGWSDNAYNIMYDRDDQGNLTLNDTGKKIMASLIYGENGSQFSDYLNLRYGSDVYNEWINTYAPTFQEIMTGDAFGETYVPGDYIGNAYEDYRMESLKNKTNLGEIEIDGTTYDIGDLYDSYDGKISDVEYTKRYKTFNQGYGEDLKNAEKTFKQYDEQLAQLRYQGKEYTSEYKNMIEKRNDAYDKYVKLRNASTSNKNVSETKEKINKLIETQKIRAGDVYTINGYRIYFETPEKYRIIE